MNARDRFLHSLLFQEVDKVPFIPGGPRESTLQRWYKEGLDEGRSYIEVICEQFGIPLEEKPYKVFGGTPVDFRMIPQYEEKILEHKDNHYLVQDWMGNIVEISDRYDLTYLHHAKDFVTRKWHRFPVENRDDWERMKKRYNPDDPSRFPGDFNERMANRRSRDFPAGIHINGPFWQLREWLGFEPLCMQLLTDPDFTNDMITFWSDFVTQLLHKILKAGSVDYLFISEDMAFKAHSMISPEMTRMYLLPVYAQWVSLMKSYGCQVILMDSDGYIEELIPVWIDAGINVCNPIEVAAHNDIVKFRKKFGKNIGYLGGIDKRLIAKGGTSIESEVHRVCSLIPMGGGIIPSCDHGVPHDISWDNFIEYSRYLAKETGWI